jgi:Na+/proline symporter
MACIAMWFATGVSFQVALMGTFGVLTKLRVPYAHTSLEFIRQRYGPIGHAVFTLLNLINNVFNGAAMILTGAQLIVSL